MSIQILIDMNLSPDWGGELTRGGLVGNLLVLWSEQMIEWRQYLTVGPAVCHGQLCAVGTRVLVTNILDSLAEGCTQEEILKSYPSLRPEHINAAQSYAAELAREESLLPLTDL